MRSLPNDFQNSPHRLHLLKAGPFGEVVSRVGLAAKNLRKSKPAFRAHAGLPPHFELWWLSPRATAIVPSSAQGPRADLISIFEPGMGFWRVDFNKGRVNGEVALNDQLVYLQTLDIQGECMPLPEPIAKLIEAARYGSEGGVKFFLKRGVPVDGADDRGWTALHWAAAKPSLDCVELLLLAGADLGALSYEGDTPLHVAASMGHMDVQRRLIRAGANIKICNRAGQAPADLAKARH